MNDHSGEDPEFDLSRRWILAGLATVGGISSLALANRGSKPAAFAGETVVSGKGTAAIQAAVDATPDGGVLRIPAGTIHEVSTVVLPDRDLTLVLYGATIKTRSVSRYAFIQSNRRRLTVMGGRFSGVGNGIRYDLSPSDTQSYDFAAVGVEFALPARSVAINLTGARESTITNCFFDSCTGIYLRESVNTHVMGCQFRNCAKGIHADGSATGSDFNAGLMVSNATMLGCGYGLHVVGWNWASVVNSMIDYCARPVDMTNIDTASIISSYLSNSDSRRGSRGAPVVNVDSNGNIPGGSSKHVRLSHSQIINHTTDTPERSVGIRLDGVEWCSITDNSIHFWQKYGVQVTRKSHYLQIVLNVFNPTAGGTAPAAVYGTNGDDSTWVIANNVLGAPIVNTMAPVVRDNLT